MVAVLAKVVADEGRNKMLNVMLCPGEIVVDAARPDALKLPPLIEARVICTLALPVFVREMVWEFVKPIGTDAKFTLEGMAVRVPIWVAGEGAPPERSAG
jgi:hypothetical protein